MKCTFNRITSEDVFRQLKGILHMDTISKLKTQLLVWFLSYCSTWDVLQGIFLKDYIYRNYIQVSTAVLFAPKVWFINHI